LLENHSNQSVTPSNVIFNATSASSEHQLNVITAEMGVGIYSGQRLCQWTRTEMAAPERTIAVVCTTAMATFCPTSASWQFQFTALAVGAADELYLSFLTPSEVVLVKHDGAAGLRTDGAAQHVAFAGQPGVTDCRAAVHGIFATALGQSEVLARVSLEDARVTDAVASHGHGARRCPAPPTAGRPPAPETPLADGEAPRAGGPRPSAVKSSQLRWHRSHRVWFVNFTKVKFALPGVRAADAFSALILALVTPRGVYAYRHDGVSGKTRAGAATRPCGHNVRFDGPRGADWRTALDAILAAKLVGCTFLAHIPLDDPRLVGAVAEHPRSEMHAAYAGDALSRLDGTTRGAVITSLARGIDRADERGGAARGTDRARAAGGGGGAPPAVEAVPAAAPRARAPGAAGGPGPPTSDWRRARDGARVTCKAVQLSWAKTHETWILRFRGVPALERDKCDELQLALYTPFGIYLYRHTHHGGAARAFTLAGPARERDARIALRAMLFKLEHGAAWTLIARIALDDDRVREALAAHPRDEMAAAYAGVALVDLPPKARGGVIETLVRNLSA
jgi:hypothetical protein